MSITCNFDREENAEKNSEKVLVRIAPGQDIGNDTPGLKPVKNGAYLWVMEPRRRNAKSWRETVSVN